MSVNAKRRVLIVAGHDPSGAGIEADRAACVGLPLAVACVVTALTDQDERGVRSIGAVEPRTWFEEAALLVAPGVDAIKFGLLPGAEHVRAAVRLVEAARARSGPAVHVVVDPVIAASSGSRFLDERAVEALRAELLTQAVIATPNLDELALLAEVPRDSLVESLSNRIAAARALLARGASAAVVKGGHGSEDPAVDLVVAPLEAPLEIRHERIPGAKVRGSGCRFASHLAARLALGDSLAAAARAAALHVRAALLASSPSTSRKPLQTPPGTVSFPTQTTRL